MGASIYDHPETAHQPYKIGIAPGFTVTVKYAQNIKLFRGHHDRAEESG